VSGRSFTTIGWFRLGSKTAIPLGAGSNQINVIGGSAVIIGGIDGGSGSNKISFNLGMVGMVITS